MDPSHPSSAQPTAHCQAGLALSLEPHSTACNNYSFVPEMIFFNVCVPCEAGIFVCLGLCCIHGT